MPIVGMLQSLSHRGGQLGRHELQHDREGARLLDRERIGEQLARRLDRLALHAVAAEAVDRLRRQADVAHDRDAGAGDRLDRPRRPHAALDLDRLGAGLADEAAGVARASLLDVTPYDRNGMSPTTSDRRVPRTTAFVWWSISSIETRTVSS